MKLDGNWNGTGVGIEIEDVCLDEHYWTNEQLKTKRNQSNWEETGMKLKSDSWTCCNQSLTEGQVLSTGFA